MMLNSLPRSWAAACLGGRNVLAKNLQPAPHSRSSRRGAIIAGNATRNLSTSLADFDDEEPDANEVATLRYELAVAHRLTAKLGLDMLTWNHISARI